MARARPRRRAGQLDDSVVLEVMASYLVENGGVERLPDPEYQRRRSRLWELQRMGSPSWALEVYTTEFRKEEQT